MRKEKTKSSEWKRAVAGTCCVAVALASCGPADLQSQADPQVGETHDAIEPFTVVTTIIGAVVFAAKLASEIESTAELNRRLADIEASIKNVQGQVVDAVWSAHQAETLGAKRDVDNARSLTFAAMDTIVQNPAMWSGPLTSALAAVQTLSQDSFYTFAGRTSTSPTRFDHRLAAPSLLEAIHGWLAVRRTARLPLDASARQKLVGYSQFLNGIASKIRANVVCTRTKTPHRSKSPSGAPGAWFCLDEVTCRDAINEMNTVPFRKDSLGQCSASTLYSPTYSAQAWATYGPDQFDQAAAALMPHNARDFNGDAQTDMMLYHGDDGLVSEWQLNGSTFLDAPNLDWTAAASTGWSVKGSGDFTGDGKSDLLWYNSNSGDISVWKLDGSTKVAGGLMVSGPAFWNTAGSGWEIKGTGDFNNDGKTDLLWHHGQSGAVAVWYMDGMTAQSGDQVSWSAPSSSGWSIAGTGDFNNDGNVDILWHHGTTGQTAVWLLRGVNVMDGPEFTGPAYARVTDSSGWLLKGTGDFNGDGYVDFLWHNGSTGDIATWFLNGQTVTSSAFVTNRFGTNMNVPASSGWQIVSR